MNQNTDTLEMRLREALALVSRKAFERGLVSGTGGNLSLRVPGTNQVLITPSGVSLADVEPGLNILVDLEGKVLKAPDGLEPSKESSFHLVAYRIRPEIRGLAHLHPAYSTAYANKGIELPLVTVSARAVLKRVPCIECALPGSPELCALLRDGLECHPGVKAILMKEHGILTLGKDLMEAYYLADLVEETAKIAYIESNIKF